MIYVDTSVWVALLTRETSTPVIGAWFARTDAVLISADWMLTEFHSAISIKVRTGQIDTVQASSVLDLFEQLGAGGMTLAPVSRTAFRAAAALVDDPRHGLRGADALHLAVAQELAVQRFASLDGNQSASAERLGFVLESF